MCQIEESANKLSMAAVDAVKIADGNGATAEFGGKLG